jgi:hypothetical protein
MKEFTTPSRLTEIMYLCAKPESPDYQRRRETMLALQVRRNLMSGDDTEEEPEGI